MHPAILVAVCSVIYTSCIDYYKTSKVIYTIYMSVISNFLTMVYIYGCYSVKQQMSLCIVKIKTRPSIQPCRTPFEKVKYTELMSEYRSKIVKACVRSPSDPLNSKHARL